MDECSNEESHEEGFNYEIEMEQGYINYYDNGSHNFRNWKDGVVGYINFKKE